MEKIRGGLNAEATRKARLPPGAAPVWEFGERQTAGDDDRLAYDLEDRANLEAHGMRSVSFKDTAALYGMALLPRHSTASFRYSTECARTLISVSWMPGRSLSISPGRLFPGRRISSTSAKGTPRIAGNGVREACDGEPDARRSTSANGPERGESAERMGRRAEGTPARTHPALHKPIRSSPSAMRQTGRQAGSLQSPPDQFRPVAFGHDEVGSIRAVGDHAGFRIGKRRHGFRIR
ncbi:MAG: hypothetical protein GMKNLPBB_01646 [Myxococcota bacterium]|nr:hypothetical protein [Myxococcota bacterium]